jgi:hypothetical protein
MAAKLMIVKNDRNVGNHSFEIRGVAEMTAKR